MKLLANENFPVLSFNIIKDAGYDAIHIGIQNPSINDEEVVQIAITQNRVILTFDSDYGTLVFKKGMRPPGVIYLRFQHFSPEFPAIFLLDLIREGRYIFEGMFSVVDDNGNIRQRKIG